MANLPVKENNGVFQKIKRTLWGIFGKNKNIKKESVASIEMKNENIDNKFMGMPKEQINREKEEDEIISIIERKPYLIDTLSLRNAQELTNMYNKRNQKLEVEIEWINRKLEKLYSEMES